MTKVTVVAGAACAAGLVWAVVGGAQDPSAEPPGVATQGYCTSETPYCACTAAGQGCFLPAVSWAMLGQAGK